MMYWILVFWLVPQNAPMIMPILFTTKAECMSTGEKLDWITKNTVKIDRNYTCSQAVVEHSAK